MSEPHRWGVRPGPALMIVASVVFTVMIAAVKHLRAELDTLDIVFWRALFALPLLTVLGLRVGLRIVNKTAFAGRLVFGFLAMTGFFAATKAMALTDLALLHKVQPLLIAVLAPILMGQAERAGRMVWGPLWLGLIGSVVLLAPSLTGVTSRYALLALAATLASTSAHLCLRWIGKTDHARAVVFWLQAGSVILAAGLLLATEGRIAWPPAHAWWPLAVAGVSAAVGQLLVTRAYAVDQATPVAAASYIGPLWSLIADIALFGILPSRWALIGGAMVLAAGLWLLRRPRPVSFVQPGPAG